MERSQFKLCFFFLVFSVLNGCADYGYELMRIHRNRSHDGVLPVRSPSGVEDDSQDETSPITAPTLPPLPERELPPIVVDPVIPPELDPVTPTRPPLPPPPVDEPAIPPELPPDEEPVTPPSTPPAPPLPPPTAPPPTPPSVDEPVLPDPSDEEETRAKIKKVAEDVDSFHRSMELLKERRSMQGKGDSCTQKGQSENNFYENIYHYVDLFQEPDHEDLGFIADIYNLREDTFPVSLNSHRMCLHSKSSLSKTLRRNFPSDSTIKKMNQFAGKYNALRDRLNDGDDKAQLDMNLMWTKLFSCLAYKESLTTADTSRSRQVASQEARNFSEKPDGVKFYLDANQPEVSRLNIGLFQFTPDSGGNVGPCIRKWNRLKGDCEAIPSRASQSEMIDFIASSQQNFNTFCGVDKVMQTFFVQINATRSHNTHPMNQGQHPQERCVSLHFYSGYAYNHYGPFQNSTGSNLDALMTCALAD